MPSTPQSIATITVFDYEMQPGSATLANPRPQIGVPIKIQLDYSLANSVSPQTNLEPVEITVVTDQNGYWQVNLVPNTNINPANTTWQVTTPSSRYNIAVPSSGPVQSSTIKVGVPVTLAPVPTTVGPLTVNGAFTVNTGPVSLPAGSVGVAALSGILPIANGGTGSGTQNFVDLTTNQTVAGNKTLSGATTLNGGLTVTGGETISTGNLAVSAGTITASGEVTGTDMKATGLTGAISQVRLAGRKTSAGPPTTGTFAIGDIVVDGNGLVWTCTGAGTPGTWTLMQVAAMVFQTNSQNFTGGSVTTLITYDTVESDPLASWNNTNHQYTAPYAGRYLVTAALNTSAQTSTAFISIYKNAAEARRGNETGAQTFSWVVSAIVKCVAGDLLDIRYFNGGGLLGSGAGAAVTYAQFTYMGV